MKVRDLKVKEFAQEISHDGNGFYIIYRPAWNIEKAILFTLAEHFVQFTDLLKEAGYKEIEIEKVRAYRYFEK